MHKKSISIHQGLRLCTNNTRMEIANNHPTSKNNNHKLALVLIMDPQNKHPPNMGPNMFRNVMQKQSIGHYVSNTNRSETSLRGTDATCDLEVHLERIRLRVDMRSALVSPMNTAVTIQIENVTVHRN